jgi:hypothetical protein
VDCGTGTCTNTKTDPLNCGGCASGGGSGVACNSDHACSNGTCVCRPGTHMLGSSCNVMGCVNLQTDPQACGMPTGTNTCPAVCSLACSDGKCVALCPLTAGIANCNNACVNTNNDPLNCGGCNKPCQTNQVCVSGTCKNYQVPPLGCTMCPCSQCQNGATCCIGPGGGVYCVEGGSCPG